MWDQIFVIIIVVVVIVVFNFSHICLLLQNHLTNLVILGKTYPWLKCHGLFQWKMMINAYAYCSSKLIVNNECQVYIYIYIYIYIYKKFGLSSLFMKQKMYDSIFHKFDQQQGQFRRQWSYLFVQLKGHALFQGKIIAGEGLQFLCRLPALAKATYRDHFCRLALSLSSATQKISVTFFLGTKQARFLIVGTEHQDGELYRVTHF